MRKPHLVITERAGNIPVQGGCSSCPQATFSASALASSNEQRLQALFNEHFRKVHMPEDASQAAARSVREATEER